MPPFYFTPLLSLLFGLFSWYNISWRIKQSPELRNGYLMVFLFWLVFINSSAVSRYHFDSPISPYLVWLPHTLALVWVFVFRGDAMLQKYPGFLFFPIGRATRIRAYVLLFVAASLIPYLFAKLPDSLYPQLWQASGLPFPFLFLGMWLLVSYILPLLSGWQWLAESYRLVDSFDGSKSGWISGNLCGVSFRHCLILGGDDQGLYIGMSIFFRLGHPPLFIPWTDLTIGHRTFLWYEMTVLSFRKAPGVILSVRTNSIRAFLPAAN